MNRNIAFVLLAVSLIIAFFLPVTINHQYWVIGILGSTEGLITQIVMGLDLATTYKEKIGYIYQNQRALRIATREMFVEYEQDNGFQRSYRYQLLKSTKYTVKEVPGFFDGMKNGYIGIYTPIVNLVKTPFIVAKYLVQFRFRSVFNSIIYLIISIVTCILSLFFMRASVLYYIGFVLGTAIGISTISFALNNGLKSIIKVLYFRAKRYLSKQLYWN